jgi:hypothetical protein
LIANDSVALIHGVGCFAKSGIEMHREDQLLHSSPHDDDGVMVNVKFSQQILNVEFGS